MKYLQKALRSQVGRSFAFILLNMIPAQVFNSPSHLKDEAYTAKHQSIREYTQQQAGTSVSDTG